MHTKKSRHLVLIASTLCLSLGLLGCPAEPTPSPSPHVKSWGTATLIETDDSGIEQFPQIACDASGDAIAIWRQSDGTRFNIWANCYIAGTGWGTARLIETDNSGDASDPQIAFDASGNAIAVWYQYDGTRYHIWANRYALGTGWGTAKLISDNSVNASGPQIALDASGNAIVAWYQSNGSNTIWARLYVTSTGWGTAARIETNMDNGGGLQVAIDASGNAIAVWYKHDGTRDNLWANRYALGTDWGTAALIETDNSGSVDWPQIAFDASGNALAVWSQSDGTRFNIWANCYIAGTGWGTAGLIETDNEASSYYPQIAFDASGNAIAVWQRTSYNIGANRYIAGTGWGTAAILEPNEGSAEAPQIACDASGNAIAVWDEWGRGRNNIWAKSYIAGTGWGTATLIETDNSEDAYYPQIAIDALGNAIAVWEQSDGTRYHIWANSYR